MVVRADEPHALQVVGDVAAGQQQAGRAGVVLAQVGGRAAGAPSTSSGSTGKPAAARVSAIRARVREVVLVTRAKGRSAARSACTASTAPGSGFQETVSTPSMSINTARTPSIREQYRRRGRGRPPRIHTRLVPVTPPGA